MKIIITLIGIVLLASCTKEYTPTTEPTKKDTLVIRHYPKLKL